MSTKLYRNAAVADVGHNGTTFAVQLTSEVISNGTGQPIGVVTTCEDISERKRAEEALRRSEAGSP